MFPQFQTGRCYHPTSPSSIWILSLLAILTIWPLYSSQSPLLWKVLELPGSKRPAEQQALGGTASLVLDSPPANERLSPSPSASSVAPPSNSLMICLPICILYHSSLCPLHLIVILVVFFPPSTHPSPHHYNRRTTNGSPTTPMPPLSASRPIRELPYGIPSPGRQADSLTYGDLCGQSQQGYPTTTSSNLDYIDRRFDIPALSAITPDTVPPPRHHVSPGTACETLGCTSSRPVGISKCMSCSVMSR